MFADEITKFNNDGGETEKDADCVVQFYTTVNSPWRKILIKMLDQSLVCLTL